MDYFHHLSYEFVKNIFGAMYRVKHCVHCTGGTPNLYLGGWGTVPWTPGGFDTRRLRLILYSSHVR
jgi:hypothetical protein